MQPFLMPAKAEIQKRLDPGSRSLRFLGQDDERRLVIPV